MGYCKRYGLFCLLFLCADMTCAQMTIEKINSDSLVKAYMVHELKMIDFEFTTGYEIAADYPSKKYDTISRLKWIKLDVNNDGRKDIIINGYTKAQIGKHAINVFHLFIFLQTDSGYSRVSLIPMYAENTPYYFNIVRVGREKLIEVVSAGMDDGFFDPENPIKRDTLVYMQGTYVNYNRYPSQKPFKTFAWYYNSAWSNEGVFFQLDDKGNLIKKKGAWWKPETVIERSSLKKNELTKIIRLVDYVHPWKLEKYYSKGLRDNGKINLIIDYADGARKEIKDDSRSYGTYGLKAIYDALYAITMNAQWK